MAIDFQAALDQFSAGGDSSDPISAIYNIIPTYTLPQQRMLMLVSYFVAKWDLDDIRALLAEMKVIYNKNKNLGMLQQNSLKALLASYTQNEMIRGIKVNAYNNSGSDSGAV